MKQKTKKMLQRCSSLIIVAAILAGCQSQENREPSETTNGTTAPTEEVSVFEPALLAQIGDVWSEDQVVVSFEVLEQERKILFEIAQTNVIQDEENGDIYDVDTQTSLYEWDIESRTMEQINLGAYSPQGIAWDGRTIVFIDEADPDTLIQATVENGVLQDVHKLVTEDGTTVSACLDLSGSSILYLAGSVENEIWSYCVGTLENGVIVDATPLEGIGPDEILSVAVLVGDNPQVFAEVMQNSTDSEIETDYRFLVPGSTGADIKNLIETDELLGLLPPISTQLSSNQIYYLENGTSVYGASLSAFIEKAVPSESAEAEPYVPGTYSCDQYDTGSFSSDLRHKTDETEKGGVYYEIFVRSFADSDGDGIGDFNGIRENLDYLQELGVEGIWLMPINASASYHGYDVTDYLSVNSEYGTEEDFKNLLDEAHERGIQVIIDFVINHTSSEHPWFLSALADEHSEYRDYYRWVHKNDATDFSTDDRSNWGSRVWHKSGDFYYYAMFDSAMPDLNYNNPAVRETIKSAAGKWLELGVDGFRLDAAMHIYGLNEFKQETDPTAATLTWWNEFALYCESINPEVYLVGEAWQDGEVLEEYVQPFDTKFNFTFQENLIDCASGQTTVTAEGKQLSFLLQDLLDIYDTVDTNYLDGVFGSNHDQERIMSTLGDEAKSKQVAAVYLTLPGNPYIYYGEELGMLGEKPDEKIRTPFLWGKGSRYNTDWIDDPQNEDTSALEDQLLDPDSMYQFYKELIALRKSCPALTQGHYEAVDLGNDCVMAYIRETDGQRLLVLHNFSNESQSLDLQKYTVEGVVFSTGVGAEAPIADRTQINGGECLILQIAP